MNRKLKELVKVFPYASFLETGNNRNLFAVHGLNPNKLGKSLVNYQIASLIHFTFEQKTSYPIILGWHETQDNNNLTSDGNQVKISNSNSNRKRKIPVTSNREHTGNMTAYS